MDNVSQTLFYPLLGRASASRQWPDLFPDPWAHQAEEIAQKEGTTAKEMDRFVDIVYGLRHRISIIEITRYLDEHPGAAVVNIGCGLDSLAQELSDYECTIYNLDFPDVIEMRGRWIPRHDNEIELPYSATDLQWLDHVDASRGVIAVAAGVFFYLEIDGVRALVAAMADRFPGGRLTYDAQSPSVTERSERMVAKNGTPARMPFKLKDPYTPRTWSDNIADINITFNFLDYFPRSLRRQLPLITFRFGMFITKLMRGVYQVTIDFAERSKNRD